MAAERDMLKPEYDDSAEFTNELEQLKEMSEKIVRIVNSPAFKQWIEATDAHFNVDTFHHARHVRRDASDLLTSVEALTEEMHRAS